MFTQHTLESAPAASRPLITSTVDHLGHLPKAVAKLAESPEMLGGFLRASATFEACTLDPVAREVVIMTIAVRNGCRVCIAMHTGRLRQLGADPATIAALRAGSPIGDQTNDAHTNDDRTDDDQTNGDRTNDHQTNGDRTNHHQTNGDRTNHHQTNGDRTNHHQTNGDRTNHHQTNGDRTNHHQTNGDRTNHHQTNGDRVPAERQRTEKDRLEAVRQFTVRLLAAAGEVPEAELAEFLAAGYTRRNALEVVLGVGTYTMSTLANRLVRA